MNKVQKFLGKVLGIRQKAVTFNGSYRIVNGTLTPITDSKFSYIEKGYSNDILYSIIQMILDKVRVVPWIPYKVVDESSLKRYEALMRKKNLSGKDFKKALDYRTKALEEFTSFDLQTGKLNDLLSWANEETTYSNLFTNDCGYKLLTGDSYIWGDVLQAGANTGLPNELWNMPSQEITIKAQFNSFPMRELGYFFNSIARDFPKEEVIHSKYWNPNYSTAGNGLYGYSPVKAALKRLNRNNSAQDASSAKFQNNGMEAIVYVDTPNINVQDAKTVASALKTQLINEYTGPQNYGKITTSGYKVGVANLGLSPVELGIIESEKWDALMFCNVYGVPPELLGLTAKTYNNMIEAEKALTTRSALPLICSHEWDFNHKLQMDWGFKGKNVYVSPDISVYTELEENKKEIVDWTGGVIAMTPNEQREQLGLPEIDDPIMNEPWVTTNSRKPLSDYQMNEVDESLSEGGGDY